MVTLLMTTVSLGTPLPSWYRQDASALPTLGKMASPDAEIVPNGVQAGDVRHQPDNRDGWSQEYCQSNA